MMTYYIIGGITALVSMAVSAMLKRRFKEFSELPISISGAEVAKRMLSDHGISDVEVLSTGGALTDHYHPTHKTVNLSQVVHDQHNVAAAAVAAHECGHAIQHVEAYSMLQLRSKMVPATKFGSSFGMWIIMGGMMLASAGGSPIVLFAGIALFSLTTFFSLVTLPVEFDASARAMKWLKTSDLMPDEYQDKAQNALKWAAMTYVVAAIASIATLVYFIMRALNSRR